MLHFDHSLGVSFNLVLLSLFQTILLFSVFRLEFFRSELMTLYLLVMGDLSCIDVIMLYLNALDLYHLVNSVVMFCLVMFSLPSKCIRIHHAQLVVLGHDTGFGVSSDHVVRRP